MQVTGNLAKDTIVHRRYRIVQLIAQGGVGAVYEALDLSLGGQVALKQTIRALTESDDAPPAPGPSTSINPVVLRGILVQRFSEGELRDLCHDLGIDYDNLPSGGKSDKARELVDYCRRHERTSELAETVDRLRPGVLPQAPAHESFPPSAPALVDTAARAFHREALLLANLRHPALPRVVDHFSEGNWHFIAMDFIPGDDLGIQLAQRRAPFPVNDVLRWTDNLLDVLHFLHTQPVAVIHRDIKPHNLKLNKRGEIVLLDFGLAKGTPEHLLLLTGGNSLPGYTLQYAPIEQIEGDGTDVRSDLYALGATLYHMLSGTPPPTALQRAKALRKHQPDPLRPLHEMNEAVPIAVSDVLMAMLALDMDERPAAVADVQAELAQARTPKAESQPDLPPLPTIDEVKAHPQEAIDLCNRHIARNPRDAKAYNLRGVARYKLKDLVGAIEDYDLALAVDSKYVDAYNNRGNAREAKGDLEGALADYRHLRSTLST